MARSRNIKPGFFQNEVLAEMDFATRLLFIGLWTEADRDGKLEDRPKKIKMAVFPADNVDVDAMLTTLHKGELITRYKSGELSLIKINKWAKHQSPHHTEKQSVLPDNVESPVNNATLTVKEQEQDGGNPTDSLIPDSLIPEPLIKDIGDSGEPPPAGKEFIQELFDKFWSHYPTKQGKQKAKVKFNVFLKGKTEGRARYWMNLMLSYYMHCLEQQVVGYDALHAATYIHNKRWEDNPDFVKEFKQQWIADHANNGTSV